MKLYRCVLSISLALFSSTATSSIINAQDLSNNSEVQQAKKDLYEVNDVWGGDYGYTPAEIKSLLMKGGKAVEILRKYNSPIQDWELINLCAMAQSSESKEYIVEFCEKPIVEKIETKTAALPSSSEIESEYKKISKIPKITAKDITFSFEDLAERCGYFYGNGLINQEKYRDKLIEYCQQSHDFALKLHKSSSDRQTYLQSYLISANNLSEAYQENKNYQGAIGYLENTLEYATGTELNSFKSFEERIADLYMLIGSYDRALGFYNQARKLIIAKNKEDREKGLLPIADDAVLAGEIGLAHLYKNNLSSAEKELDNIDFRNETVYDERNSTFNTANYNDTDYTLLERLKVKQGKIEEALKISESKRGRLLSQAISSERDNLSIAQIKSIAKQQNSTIVLYSLIADSFQPVIQKDLNNLYKPLEHLYIWVVSPSGKIYFRQVNFSSSERVSYNHNRIIFANISFISLLVLGIVLGFIPFRKNKFLVCLGTVIVCFGIVSCTSQIYTESTIESDSLIDNASNDNFNSALPLQSLTQDTFASVKTNSRSADSSSALNKSCGQEEDCLKQLYNLTIKPIADLLPSDEGEQVIFIPDAELFKVPFPALIDSKGRHLIERYTIRTSPSIKLFQLIDKLNKKHQADPSINSALVVGNPIMPKVKTNQFEDEIELSQLPGTEDEAQEIARILNTEPLIGEEATEIEIFNRISQSKTIYIATHGVLNATIPSTFGYDKSLLTLTPSETNLDLMRQQAEIIEVEGLPLKYYAYDGLLTNDDISVLDLSNTDLVVLSACDTGRGRITADGVHGIARPFIVKGANSAVVSLWQVPDSPTAELMVEFYQNLQSGKNKAQALRQAMLTTKEKYPEPYNWAAFTLVGEAI